MSLFERKPAPAVKIINARVTVEEDALIAAVAARLELSSGKSGLMLQALRYYLEHDPRAREAVSAVQSQTSEPSSR